MHCSNGVPEIHDLRTHFSFSSGPAGLLSPLQTTTRSDNLVCSSLLGAHQNGGRASEMLAGLRRHHPYIKEEVPYFLSIN